MGRRFVILAGLVILAGSQARLGQAADLPPGAVLRLGSVQYRAGGPVERLEFGPDSMVLIATVRVAGASERFVVWDATYATPPADREPIRTVGAVVRWNPAALPNSSRGVVLTPEGVAVVRDFETGRDVARLAGHFARVTAVSVSPDGRRLATGSADGLVRLWDAETCRPLTEPKGHTAPVSRVEVAPDGRTVLTTAADGTARIWDLATGRELRAFPASADEPASLTADGTAVVLTHAGRTVVRDLVTGLEIVPTTRPTVERFRIGDWLQALAGICVAVSPDGRTIALGTASGSVVLYESATGEIRRRLTGHGGACLALAFTPDGARLITASADHTALVWAVRLQDVPLSAALKRETNAARLWDTMTRGDGAAAYAAAARLAADPAAAVKMARLRLTPGTSAGERGERRAMELLEAIGTADARALLHELARDPNGLRVREATAALNRLVPRP